MQTDTFVKQPSGRIARDMNSYLLDILAPFQLSLKNMYTIDNSFSTNIFRKQTLFDIILQDNISESLIVLDQLIHWLTNFQIRMISLLGFPVELTNFHLQNFIYQDNKVLGYHFDDWKEGEPNSNYFILLAWLKFHLSDTPTYELLFNDCIDKISQLLVMSNQAIYENIHHKIAAFEVEYELLNRSSTIDSFIITGGKSTRMGTPKQELSIGNYTFLEHLQYKLRRFSSTRLSVGDSWNTDSLHLNCIPDLIPNLGPIGGIYSALSSSQNEHIFIVPCDMPSIDDNIIYSILHSLKDSDNCVIARINGRVHPLIGIYKKSTLPFFHSQIEQKNYKMMNLLQLLSVNYVDIKSENDMKYGNINDMATYQTTLNQLNLTAYPYTSFIKR